MNNLINFLEKISGFDQFGDAYLEVVSDYNVSKYFNDKQIDELIQYAKEMSKSGHEIHFGPAPRKSGLGTKTV